ncbi:MAG: hypothetical protein KAS32_18950 [Candidatus Peribacteraceae bacterium]|nr:hypothetical protein [Candidatus Peribacteraceae bacterium]
MIENAKYDYELEQNEYEAKVHGEDSVCKFKTHYTLGSLKIPEIAAGNIHLKNGRSPKYINFSFDLFFKGNFEGSYSAVLPLADFIISESIERG